MLSEGSEVMFGAVWRVLTCCACGAVLLPRAAAAAAAAVRYVDDNYSSNLRVEATYRGKFGWGVLPVGNLSGRHPHIL